MKEQFQYLFTPFKIGPVTVRNRIGFPAHGTQFADKDHLMDERYVEYQRARAKGGVGVIVAGMMNVMFNCRDLFGIQEIYDERVVPRLRQLAGAVHQEGAKVFVQLCHAGRETDTELTQLPVWAPSPIPSTTLFRDVPKEMEIEDINEVVKAFSRATGFAKEAGLDGIEIHGASGYLVECFMSPYTNKRTDEYGGSLENRLRFPLEVIDAIRETVGNDLALGIRLPGDELVPGGNNLDDMVEIAQRLEATGSVDYISVSLGFYEGIFALGMGMHVPLGFLNPYAARFKEAVDLPIWVTLRINDPIQAEKILAEGQADLVGMCRALIADPELPNKARKGRLDEIRPCIACNQGCLGRAIKGKPITCVQNPAVGKEKEIGTLDPAKTKKKVMVIGGGPGGMEAARMARLRGHEVVLYEKENDLGGQVNIATKVPIRKEFGGCTRYLIKQMEILGVKLNLGVEVTPEMIEQEAPDAVLVATGSTPSKPPLPGADQDNVLSVWDVLQEKVEVGEKVVVVDGGEAHWQCCGTAEYLADKGKKVEIITPLMVVGMELAATWDLTALYMRLRSKGVVLSPNTALKEISGKTVVALDIYANTERRIEGVDTVVLATGNQANNQLYRNLKGKVKELHVVGDCLAPRKAMDAIYEGYNVGRIL
ncbi:MAG: FAD-dependent oxidoreductase [Candidatus Hodarchaeota archaeon]